MDKITTPIGAIVNDIRIAAGQGKWLSCSYLIDTEAGVKMLGVKAFGKWVQRLECGGIKDTVNEQRTWKQFRVEFDKSVDGIMRGLGTKMVTTEGE